MDLLHRTLTTPFGTLRAVVPDAAFLNRIARWPRPVMHLGRDEPPGWAICFGDDTGPLLGLRVGFGWFDREELAQDTLAIQRLLMPATLAEFRRQSQAAALLACAFLRTAGAYWQSGYVVFVAPEPPEAPLPAEERVYDDALGAGATSALYAFLRCAEQTWLARGQPPRTISDLDLVTFDDCGAVGFDLMLAGESVVWLRDELDGEGPFTKEMLRAGITEIVDFPAIPLAAPPAPAAGNS